MKILGLPGIKPVTEQWMKQLLDSLELGQSETTVQQYQCWSRPGSGLDMKLEADIAASTCPDLVVAKSIGTRVAIYAFAQGMLSVKTCVFLGIPLRGCSSEESGTLQQLCAAVPILLIQQTADPAGGYHDLVSLIPETQNCGKREVPGNDHMYGDIPRLKQIIESWYKQYR